MHCAARRPGCTACRRNQNSQTRRAGGVIETAGETPGRLGYRDWREEESRAKARAASVTAAGARRSPGRKPGPPRLPRLARGGVPFQAGCDQLRQTQAALLGDGGGELLLGIVAGTIA